MASDFAEARRIAADQYDRENQQEREAARSSCLGAVMHSMRAALGMDRARQEREAAAQRARADAVQQALNRQHREQQLRAVPEHWRPLIDVVQGEHQQDRMVNILLSLAYEPQRALDGLAVVLHSLDDREIANEREFAALWGLASHAIRQVPHGDQQNLQRTAELLETLTSRLDEYDAHSARYGMGSDRPRPRDLHTQLYDTVMRARGPISIYNLRDAPRDRYAEIYRRREARDRNQSRGYSPER